MLTRCNNNNIVFYIAPGSPVSGWVKSLRLSFFGHLAATAPEADHHRVISATLRPPAEREEASRSPENYLAEDNR